MNTRTLAIALTVIALLLVAACGGSDGGGSKPATDQGNGPGQAAPSQAQDRDTGATEERDTTTDQISTFALDVDTASYGYARRVLQEGRLPEPGQIRPEEFVNSFRQDYEEPRDDGFTVHLDGARMPENGTALVRVGLQTRKADAEARRPANLTFVVDVSGSMGEPGRLDLVREALHKLVDQLGPGDQVSVVAFSGEAELVVPMTSADGRDALHAAIERLAARESTNLESGLTTGYAEASRAFRPAATNRVILLSDGLANTGDTSWQGILTRVKEFAGRQVTLLCVGVGRDYGDQLMEQLADNGDGAAVYVGSADDARKVFVEQLATNLDLRARDAKAQVVFNPSAVESYHLIGYENRQIATEDFRDDAKDGGEIGPGHSVTALYKVRLRSGASGQLAMATVRWQDPDTRDPGEASRSLESADLSASLWSGPSPRFQVDVVAAAFAEYLRTHEQIAGVGAGELAEHATRLAASTEDATVTDLAGLIGRAASLG
ncbi:von Willebrand factor type A domain-containing protein [Streptosporangium sp. NBC_01639]|uniref:vWA domain-containing protein n=1 Tax=unclassified Streptosporangium TaxID=2632669 RepID=UPI002DD89617|nr:von Willebrand factor type A domain-containing protein [Streptosporangium sp. NBC_01756]WSC88114.1 von Willebrand factor type A domain-containing protein [Streptosporangium sp. NBC_01756]WTD53209.1 von Willebrand factor type A domain-containing protein [Streptosporangium sp. NBC_01639]